MAHKGGSESQATKLPAGSALAAVRAGMDDAAHAAAAEFEKQMEEQTVQQPEQQTIEKENAEPAWNIVEWLRSLNYEEAFQEFLEKAAKDVGLSPFELVKRYADAGKEPELSSLLKVAIPDVCRRTIKGAKETLRASAVTGAELNSKFAETGTFTLAFAELRYSLRACRA